MKALLALLLFPALACAQPEPVVLKDSDFDDYDLESMKAGEWVLKESSSKVPLDGRGSFTNVAHRERLACVRADEEKVWIESSAWDLEAKEPVFVRLYEVDRKTRKALKAWQSEKGAVAVEAKVEPSEKKVSSATKSDNLPGTKSVVKDKLKVGTSEVSCNVVKVEESPTDMKGKTIKKTTERWFSDAVPFRLRLADAEVRFDNGVPGEVGKEMKTSQACVKLNLATSDDSWKVAVSVVDFGTDAKPTVKTK